MKLIRVNIINFYLLLHFEILVQKPFAIGAYFT